MDGTEFYDFGRYFIKSCKEKQFVVGILLIRDQLFHR